MSCRATQGPWCGRTGTGSRWLRWRGPPLHTRRSGGELLLLPLPFLLGVLLFLGLVLDGGGDRPQPWLLPLHFSSLLSEPSSVSWVVAAARGKALGARVWTGRLGLYIQRPRVARVWVRADGRRFLASVPRTRDKHPGRVRLGFWGSRAAKVRWHEVRRASHAGRGYWVALSRCG